MSILTASLLLFGACSPVLASVQELATESLSGHILYVGGHGPGNYTKIGSALKDAEPGDTVFVYDDSSPYAEYLRINKTVRLTGENKNTTILNTTGQAAIDIGNTENVTISGFTIVNQNEDWCDTYGIWAFESNNLTIVNNRIIGCNYSIELQYLSNCTVTSNEVTGGTLAIDTYDVSSSTFSNNFFIDDPNGFNLNEARFNIIVNNTFINSGMSLIDRSYPNYYSGNKVNSKPLVYLENTSGLTLDNEPVGQIILVNCKNIQMRNLDLSNATIGLELINTNDCLLTNSTVCYNQWGGVYMIELCKDNVFSYNTINYNGNGIGGEEYACFNRIFRNSIRSNGDYGILLVGAGNSARFNLIENNSIGISIQEGLLNIVSKNSIQKNTEYGILIAFSGLNLIKSNNIIKNKRNVFFYISLGNVFIRNYWKPRFGLGPKMILGRQLIPTGFFDRWGFPILIEIPWVKFDWFPKLLPNKTQTQ